MPSESGAPAARQSNIASLFSLSLRQRLSLSLPPSLQLSLPPLSDFCVRARSLTQLPSSPIRCSSTLRRATSIYGLVRRTALSPLALISAYKPEKSLWSRLACHLADRLRADPSDRRPGRSLRRDGGRGRAALLSVRVVGRTRTFQICMRE